MHKVARSPLKDCNTGRDKKKAHLDLTKDKILHHDDHWLFSEHIVHPADMNTGLSLTMMNQH